MPIYAVGIAQVPSINTPTIRRPGDVDAGLSLANSPRHLRIRRLLRGIHLPEMVRKLLLRRSLRTYTGVEINARPLARGEWKPRGMSRIFAEVVRRASCFFFLPLLVEKSLYPF